MVPTYYHAISSNIIRAAFLVPQTECLRAFYVYFSPEDIYFFFISFTIFYFKLHQKNKQSKTARNLKCLVEKSAAFYIFQPLFVLPSEAQKPQS